MHWAGMLGPAEPDPGADVAGGHRERRVLDCTLYDAMATMDHDHADPVGNPGPVQWSMVRSSSGCGRGGHVTMASDRP
ncbi:hypothetical protein B1987_14795 [Mycobacterium kansasii]|nr:hypothetical protein B1987_14795 [Mycobacterium kansasii]